MPFVVTLLPPPSDAFRDIPARFGTFPPEDDLLLENLEVKKKLKPGLPMTAIKILHPYVKPKSDHGSRPDAKPVAKPDVKPVTKPVAKPVEPTSKSSEESSFESSSGSSKSVSKSTSPPGVVKPSTRGSSSHGSLGSLESSGTGASSAGSRKSGSSGSRSSRSKSGSTGSRRSQQPETPPPPPDPYAGMTPEQREKAEKDLYLDKWLVMKKSYPRKQFPEFTEDDDLDEIKTKFMRAERELKIEANLARYRGYLMVTFYVLELLIGFFTDDIKGFTNFQAQVQVVATYDAMLVELGEKTQSSWFANLPIEVKLAGMVGIQAAAFVLAKVLSRRGGGDAIIMIYGFLGIEPPALAPAPRQTTQAAPNGAPPGMQGPRLTPEQIRNMAKPKQE